MKDVSTLKDLMLLHLLSLSDAESQWSFALQKTSQAISSDELKKIFEAGSKRATEHVEILKNLLSKFGKSTLSKRNVIANDLSREMRELPDTAADSEVLDAALIVTHQCMNHYMIAKYGSVSSYASLLQEEAIANTLHQILEEEKEEDEKLSALAEQTINVKAKTALIL